MPDNEKCFFCDRDMVPREFLPSNGFTGAYKPFYLKHGHILKEGGNIGDKRLCESCVEDLRGIANTVPDY